MKLSIWDIVKSINYTKEDLSEHEQFDKEYNPYLINRTFSHFQDTLPYADYLNQRSNISKSLQYKFYLNLVSKGKRFKKWGNNKSKDYEDIKMISKYFNCNMKRAEEYFNIISIDDLTQIKNNMSTGGIEKS